MNVGGGLPGVVALLDRAGIGRFFAWSSLLWTQAAQGFAAKKLLKSTGEEEWNIRG
jgi:hypothetical protein